MNEVVSIFKDAITRVESNDALPQPSTSEISSISFSDAERDLK